MELEIVLKIFDFKCPNITQLHSETYNTTLQYFILQTISTNVTE